MSKDFAATAQQLQQVINSGDQSKEARDLITSLQARFNAERGQYDKEQENANALADQTKLYNGYYDQAATRGIDQFRQALAPQRSNLISEEAALGRLDSPVARASLDRFDAQGNQGISSMLASLAGQQAQGYQGNQQFNQTLGFDRDKLSQQMAQFNAQLGFDREKAAQQQRQFEDQQPSGLDKGFGYAKTASDIWKNVMPKPDIPIPV